MMPQRLIKPLRRSLWLGAAAAGLLAACGFQPRREPELLFHSLALTGFAPNSPLASELRRQLARTPVQVVEDANKAELVLEALLDTRDKVSVVSTSAGQVREWQLRVKLDYLLRTTSGDLLLPRTELRMSRDLNYTETMALAKEQEEAQLYRSMNSDVVNQLLRRLAAVRLPG
ncbi:LPS-assembly lipoprotein LptE [Roseateles koreensis]|uniref:LPS-assembly lipoprotein LptE n=1 Tax=Roseateles koreensis TaxID=2987526 RepID=A0ABT5KVN8_9BURK|nr:LPS assembly lipoprotein LptE [Roseateles koreensis]MDC8787007.1 LPS assembly lipoprotein LptE [Roseateles koreensis]